MPNPFPGMNPYLEDPRHWRSVHHWLISSISSALNRELPEDFATFVEERVYVEGWGKDYYPDVLVVERPVPIQESNVAVLERTATEAPPFDAPFRFDFGTRTVRESYLEIRTTDDREELIAAIEVLSPTNKEPGPGRDEYVRKQQNFLNSMVHFVEIDLLRAGEYTVAPPEIGIRTRTGDFDYIVSLHRGGGENRFEVWTATLRKSLPKICIPLTPEAGEVYLDLQAVLNRAYEDGGMQRAIRYNMPTVPPLSETDATWTDELLRDKGLR